MSFFLFIGIGGTNRKKSLVSLSTVGRKHRDAVQVIQHPKRRMLPLSHGCRHIEVDDVDPQRRLLIFYFCRSRKRNTKCVIRWILDGF